MKKIFIFIIFSFTAGFVHCQIKSNATTCKAYRNSLDFNNNIPLFTADFFFTKKNNNKVPDLYKVKSVLNKINKRTIKNTVWGLYSDSTFYLNIGRLGMVNGYVKIPKLKNYSYFRGSPVKSINQEARIINASVNFGLIGGAVSGSIVEKENRNNIHYILNTKTGMINCLNRNYLIRVLQPYDDLLFYFQIEKDKDSLEVLLHYIDLLNKKME